MAKEREKVRPEVCVHTNFYLLKKKGGSRVESRDNCMIYIINILTIYGVNYTQKILFQMENKDSWCSTLLRDKLLGFYKNMAAVIDRRLTHQFTISGHSCPCPVKGHYQINRLILINTRENPENFQGVGWGVTQVWYFFRPKRGFKKPKMVYHRYLAYIF